VRAAIYARLSENPGGRSESVAIQTAECREFCEERGWTVVDVFSDDDISASRYSTKPRERYNALLDAINAGEVDVVLVTEMSRLYRRLEELLELIHLAEATPLRAIETTGSGGYDLSTGDGIHRAVDAVNNAVLESRRTSDRLKRNKKAQAKEGRFNGGSRPYGYEGAVRNEHGDIINRHRIGVAVVEKEADVVRDVVARLLDGHSLRSIIHDLNDREVPSSTGTPWHPQKVRRILESKRIIGIRTHHDLEYPARWPAIISREDWEQIQLIFRAEDRSVGANKKGVRSYLLTGLIYCGLCHNNLLVGSASQGPREDAPRRRYRCRRINVYGKQTGCGQIVRLAEPVEALVTEAVLYRYNSPEMAKALAGDGPGAEIGGLIEKYTAQKAKLDDLIADYASGLLNRQQLAQAKAIVEDALTTTKTRIAQLQNRRALASVPVGQSIREAWASSDLEWRRSLISLVVEKVILHPGRAGSNRWKDKATGKVWQFDAAQVEIVWKA
jgi:site-specific DNA recombinase